MAVSMQIELDWLHPFEEDSPEGLTYAALTIRVGDCIVTEVEDSISQTLRDDILVSVYPLARFMVENWWRLRWEPPTARMDAAWRLRHCLSATGDGYSWPNLQFASDGEAIHIHLNPGSDSRTAPVRYVNSLSEWISAEEFERAIDGLLEAVSGRLDAVRQSDTELAGSITDLRAERNDPEVARWRRLEAIAGYDADEAPEAFIRDLLAESRSIGWQSLQELTAASRERTLQDLARIRQELTERGTRFQIAELPRLQDTVTPKVADETSPPWSRAAAAARAARHLFGMNGEVVTNDRLAEVFQVPVQLLATGEPASAPCSASSHCDNEQYDRLVINKPLSTSRRFAVCRLLGDRLCSDLEATSLSTATDAGTARQKFQRAFAQELLCPFDALMNVLDSDAPSDDDIDAAADHFQVSPLLVRTTLVNRHLLARDTLVDVFR